MYAATLLMVDGFFVLRMSFTTSLILQRKHEFRDCYNAIPYANGNKLVYALAQQRT